MVKYEKKMKIIFTETNKSYVYICTINYMQSEKKMNRKPSMTMKNEKKNRQIDT